MKRAKKNRKLEAGLQAYGESVGANGSLVGFKERLGNWPMYAAAVGSALALSTSAVADIISSGPLNVSVNNGAIDFVVGGDGFGLSNMNRSHISGPYHRFVDGIVNLAALGGGQISASGSLVNAFQASHHISSLPNGRTGILLIQSANIVVSGASRFSSFGNWHGGTAYAAFKLSNGDLGWMKIAAGGNFATDTKLLAWAYNDVPGAPIHIPDTQGPVPEPSSLALALLAIGSAGVLAWRRRKSDAAQAAGSAR
jgi:hypothetical protein